MTVIRLPGSLSPERNECLPCFLARVLARVGCAGTFEWTKEWRAVRSPRATSLEDRLSSLGAECDCLVLAHLYQPQLMLWTRSAAGGLIEPNPMPVCAGVRPRSTKPCTHWTDRQLWSVTGDGCA